MSDIRIATAGEALIDIVTLDDGKSRPCMGGASYNLSRALARQGLPVAYLNPLSQDPFGRNLAHQLLRDGALLASPDAVPEATSLATVSLDASGKPDYKFSRKRVADRCISSTHLIALSQSFGALDVVATGGLALVHEDRKVYGPWLAACRKRGVMVVVDANLRPAVASDLKAYRDSVLAALAQADLIKVSDDDLQVLFDSDEDPLLLARRVLASTPAEWLILTLGARGAVLFRRKGQVLAVRDTRELVVADTVGAGDCFLAGLLGGLLEASPTGRPKLAALTVEQISSALRRGVASASHCVEQEGCVPANRADIIARLAQGSIEISSLAPE